MIPAEKRLTGYLSVSDYIIWYKIFLLLKQDLQSQNFGDLNWSLIECYNFLYSAIAVESTSSSKVSSCFSASISSLVY